MQSVKDRATVGDLAKHTLVLQYAKPEKTVEGRTDLIVERSAISTTLLPLQPGSVPGLTLTSAGGRARPSTSAGKSNAHADSKPAAPGSRQQVSGMTDPTCSPRVGTPNLSVESSLSEPPGSLLGKRDMKKSRSGGKLTRVSRSTTTDACGLDDTQCVPCPRTHE